MIWNSAKKAYEIGDVTFIFQNEKKKNLDIQRNSKKLINSFKIK